MSRNRKSQKLELTLNLSLLPPARGDTSRRAAAAEEVASPGSCLSSEAEPGMGSSPASPEAAAASAASAASASMVVAGCPQCLMYVMLSEDDLRCPKCGSTVLLYFCGDDGRAATKSKSSHGSKKKA